MRVTVVGAGYVGLVSAASFGKLGFDVCLADIDTKKIREAKAGVFHTYEPEVRRALKEGIEAKHISISENLADTMVGSDAIVVAVSSAKTEGVDSDLSFLLGAMKTIATALTRDKYRGIFVKTNVPAGTCRGIAENFKSMRPDLTPGTHYDIIANPGFLREGTGIKDFVTPERIIIGLGEQSSKAQELISKLYMADISDARFIITNFETAELIRSVITNFTAIEMAFINEISELCDKLGADINAVIKAVSLEQSSGSNSLQITPAIGGTSIPRNMRILVDVAKSLGVNLQVLEGALRSNTERISKIKNRIINLIKDEKGITSEKISIFGLTFKPMVNDIKESASILVIKELLDSGVLVFAYDPALKPDSKELYRIPSSILENKNFHLVNSAYDAAIESDIIVIMTNWAEFLVLDYSRIYELMNKPLSRKPVILDYRNMLLDLELPEFTYVPQGAIATNKKKNLGR